MDKSVSEPIIFCDTNAYLWLYESRKKDVINLLHLLSKIKANLFVPAQVVNEVMRRKLTCLENSHKSNADGQLSNLQSDFQGRILPEYYVNTENNEKVLAWNKKFRKLKNEASLLKSEFHEAYGIVFEAVATSEDTISRYLYNLFAFPVKPTDEELSRAKSRASYGNPPGKQNGPIGDQIIWEQLLDHIKENLTREVWIVSKDSDFVISKDKRCFLHPSLYREMELEFESSVPEVRLFANLPEMFKFYEENINPDFESDMEHASMEILAKEIQRHRDIYDAYQRTGYAIIPLGTTHDQLRFGFMNDYSRGQNSLFDELIHCPRCGKEYQKFQAVGGAMLCPHCERTDPFWLDGE